MVVDMKYVNSYRLSVEFLAVVYIKLVTTETNAVRPAAKHCRVFSSPHLFQVCSQEVATVRKHEPENLYFLYVLYLHGGTCELAES